MTLTDTMKMYLQCGETRLSKSYTLAGKRVLHQFEAEEKEKYFQGFIHAVLDLAYTRLLTKREGRAYSFFI